jgi:hypothetical protein
MSRTNKKKLTNNMARHRLIIESAQKPQIFRERDNKLNESGARESKNIKKNVGLFMKKNK